MIFPTDQIERLRHLVLTEEEFGDTWSYFFDHFGSNAEFMANSQPAPEAEREKLEEILNTSLKRMAGREVMIIQFQLMNAPSNSLLHGPCLTDAGIALIMYLPDIEHGMIQFTQGLGTPDGTVQYARFTAIPVAGKNNVYLPTKSTGH